jgi:hypothetical protein
MDTRKQRESERVPFIEDVLVEGTKHCTSNDISQGGLYISTIQAFEEDSLIDVTVPFKGENLTLKAKVRHCQPGMGIGIMFVDLDEGQKAKIRELIEGLAKT